MPFWRRGRENNTKNEVGEQDAVSFSKQLANVGDTNLRSAKRTLKRCACDQDREKLDWTCDGHDHVVKNIRATHGWILCTGTVHVVRISKTKRWKALQFGSKSKMGFPQSSWRGTSHLRFWMFSGSRFLKPVPGKFQGNSVSRNHQGCTNWARGIRFVNQVSGTKSGSEILEQIRWIGNGVSSTRCLVFREEGVPGSVNQGMNVLLRITPELTS